MRSRSPARASFETGHGDTTVRDANFYALPFASQMIVWAVRRRINAICFANSSTDDDVLSVFHVANWGELYAALLTIVDILVGASVPHRFPLHAVSCPCLAPHEAYLLNALAHLERGDRDEAALCLCEVIAPASARLAMPHLGTVFQAVKGRNLRFAFVDLSGVEPRHGALSTAPGSAKHVH